MFIQLPCFEITEWRPIAAKLFLENKVFLQGKCLPGCKEGKHCCKESTMVPSGGRSDFLSKVAGSGRLPLELITKSGGPELGNDKLGGVGGPGFPSVAKELDDGVVEQEAELDAPR